MLRVAACTAYVLRVACRMANFRSKICRKSRFLRFEFLQVTNFYSLPRQATPLLARHKTIKTLHYQYHSSTRHSSSIHINSRIPMMSSIPAASVYPATTTTVVQPGVVAQPRYAVYDKPADRRLRPWILLGSVLLGVCSLPPLFPRSLQFLTLPYSSLTHYSPSLQCLAAAMIIFTFVDQGRINSLWGLFIAGCILGGAAILGFITGFTLRPGFKGLVCLLTSFLFFPYISPLFSLYLTNRI